MSDSPARLADFEVGIANAIDGVALPSIAYGVSRGRETLLQGAIGVADKRTGRPATADTPFSLASITKPMTATALMRCVERELIHLDAPVERYLAGARLGGLPRAEGATVERVAAHIAGLPLHFQFYYEDEPYRRPPMKETIARYGKIFTLPGAHYQYSNLGYGLLDFALENVTGKSYADVMAEEVFGPLGMSRSSIGPPPDAAVPYGRDGVEYPWYDFDHPGGSAAFASIEDLLAFGQLHLGLVPKLLSAESLGSMHSIRFNTRPNGGYGLGWGISEDRLGYRMVEHTGSMGGVSTILRLVPEEQLAIAIVANGDAAPTGRFADDAFAAVCPDFRERLSLELPAPKPRIDPLPERLCGRWTGEVETGGGKREFALDLVSVQTALATLDGRFAPIEELHLRDGRLLGVFDGDLQDPDAARRPYRIHLDLTVESNRLFGAAVALTENPSPGGSPGRRLGNALAYWTDLRRQP